MLHDILTTCQYTFLGPASNKILVKLFLTIEELCMIIPEEVFLELTIRIMVIVDATVDGHRSQVFVSGKC